MERKVINLDDSYGLSFTEQTISDCVIISGDRFMTHAWSRYLFKTCKFINCIIKDIKSCRFEKCEFIDCEINSDESIKYSFFSCKIIESSINLNEYNSCYFFDCVFKKSKITSITELFRIIEISRCVFDKECTCEVNAKNYDYFCIAESRVPNNFLPMTCPKSGEFIGYKKCYHVMYPDNEYPIYRIHLVALLIPADAKRSSGTSNKCRCSKAKVFKIYNPDGSEANVDSVSSMTISHTPITYKKGDWVYPDSFDEDRFNECSHGIHFFMTFDEAVEYCF